MGIPDHLTCLLRNLYAGQEAIVRTLYGITVWFKIEKGVWQVCLLSPQLYAEHIIRNARLDELKAGIKIGRRNINNLRYADDHSNGRKRRGTKGPLDEGEGEWKSWFKIKYLKKKNQDHGIQSHYCMANRRGIGESTDDFIYLGSKITVDVDCSHEIGRQLLLGRKTMTNLDSVLKSRDITLLTEVRLVYAMSLHSLCIVLVKAMVFSLVRCGCDSWTVQNAECKKLMPSNCGAGKDSWKSPGQQGDQSSQS